MAQDVKEYFPLSLRWLIFRRIPTLLTIFKPNTPHGERGEIVGLSSYYSDWASNRQQKGMYLLTFAIKSPKSFRTTEISQSW